MSGKTVWEPPSIISREEVVRLDREVAARPALSLRIYEDIFRIQALELDWDIGIVIYEPQDLASIPNGTRWQENRCFSSSWRRFRLQIC